MFLVDNSVSTVSDKVEVKFRKSTPENLSLLAVKLTEQDFSVPQC